MARAVKLYECAIEKTGDLEAIFNLGVLLAEGAEGVGIKAVRAVELYERAIDERVKSNQWSISVTYCDTAGREW